MSSLATKAAFLSLLPALLLAACVGPSSREGGDHADRILHGGTVLTVDANDSIAEAVAVRDGRILAVGTEAEVLRHRGASTEMTDLEGRTLAPGFIDGHAHVGSFGMQAIGANLLAAPDGEVETVEDLVAEMRTWAAENAEAIERFGMV